MNKKLTTEFSQAKKLDNKDMVQVGQFYWHKEDKILMFVDKIGTNFVRLTAPISSDSRREIRVHFDDFFNLMEIEEDANNVIQNKIAWYNQKIKDDLEEIHRLCNKLGLALKNRNDEKTGTMLATVNSENSVEDYKKSLILAQEQTLPELQTSIKENSIELKKWNRYNTLHLENIQCSIKDKLSAVDDRLHNLTLYAGISEEVNHIKRGQSANIDDKIHVMQRMCYMDEESLIDYHAGGMEYRNITDFDEWLCSPQNLEKILPFPKTICAFRVRREKKYREVTELASHFVNLQLAELDKSTFIYVRNGDNVYRLETNFKFSEKVFPNSDVYTHQESMLIRRDFSNIEFMRLDEWEVSRQEKFPAGRSNDDWERFNKDSVFYDDAVQQINKEINSYNKIILIMQGILDRSDILSPVAKINLSKREDFIACVKPIYDDFNVLSFGEKPDFEAYRSRLNSKLKVGSVIVGQRNFYRDRKREEREEHYNSSARKYNRSFDNGVGILTTVVKVLPRKKEVVVSWTRPKLTGDSWGEDLIEVKMNVPFSKILNLDEYKKGDYKTFLADHRTRREYLKWADYLLIGEDYVNGFAELDNCWSWKKSN